MPDSLKQRKTLRFIFKQGAMQKVPAGLYDVRMESGRTTTSSRTSAARSVSTSSSKRDPRVRQRARRVPGHHITDTQVSVGDSYGAKTKDKLNELVQFLNTTSEDSIKKSAFITFNGRSPQRRIAGEPSPAHGRADLQQRGEGDRRDAQVSPRPIFLTAGNHDGYVAIGHVPGAVKALDTVSSTASTR